MDNLSRRSMLRLLGGAAGAAAVGTVPGLVLPTMAATAQRVTVKLDKPSYRRGERMTLSITETLVKKRRIRVSDSSGLVWTKTSADRSGQVWKATATTNGSAVVTARMTRGSDSAVFVATAGYHVGNDARTAAALTAIGMSSPASAWSQRIAEVGSGVTARRIFADLSDGPTDQIKLVEQAHAAGMMPVISYKVGGDAAGAASGKFNAVAEKAASRLASYGLPTTVTFWHEPHGNLSPAQYVAGSKQLLPIFKRGEVQVGPLLNGWLLDRQVSTFTSYCPDELFKVWDWFGIDTYESGTMQAPGPVKPASRIPKLVDYLATRGSNHRIGVGEYNGYSAKTIADAGNAILGTPQVWFGCMWNATGGKGYALTGDRLAAFKKTLADPRAAG